MINEPLKLLIIGKITPVVKFYVNLNKKRADSYIVIFSFLAKKMTENEYEDDLEAKMSQIFGDESKENKAKDNVRRSSRPKKKRTYLDYESDPDLSELTNGKKSKKAADVHKSEKKYVSFEYEHNIDIEIINSSASSSFGEEDYR